MAKSKISPKLRRKVLERDNFRCRWCGRSEADDVTLHVDHVLPESFGGSTTFENLGTLCSDCNLGKGNECCGDYLLTTLRKTENIWNNIVDIDKKSALGPDGKLYDGSWHELRLPFLMKKDTVWREEKVSHYYLFSGQLMVARDIDAEMRIAEMKKKALLELKKRVKDFLFQNKGYLEQQDGKLVFVRR